MRGDSMSPQIVCPLMSHRLIHHLVSTHSSTQWMRSSSFLQSNHDHLLALCRAGKINHARNLFDDMPNKNTVAFSVMIYGYASHGLFPESIRIFSLMQLSRVRPNSFTFVAVLLGSAGMRASRLGESVHARIVAGGLESNPFVRTSLLGSYAKCGNPVNSYKLFAKMDPPRLPACNAMIGGFADNGLFEEALLLFKTLGFSNLAPNPATMLPVARSSAGFGSLRLCESVHGSIVKAGLGTDIIVVNSVLDMYLSFGDYKMAMGFFEKMEVKDVISWTTMIGFLVGVERPSEALRTFCEMKGNNVEPDMVTMITVIAACGLSGDLQRGRSVHSQILVRGFGSELSTMNSLITMYSNSCDLGSAEVVFDHILTKSSVSWTAMMSSYIQNDHPRKGLILLMRMRREENFNIDSISLASSLTACGELASIELCMQLHGYSFKSGVTKCRSVENSFIAAYGRCGGLDLARKVFREFDFERDSVSWNAMISAYGLNGRGEAALALFLEMEKSDIEPDGVTYLNLLSACSHSGLVDEGMTVFERMKNDKRIEPRGEHFGCAVDIFARAGRLEEARKLACLVPDEMASGAWKALLGGCRNGDDAEVAVTAASRVFRTGSVDPGHVVSLSKAYASAGSFANAEVMRLTVGKKESRKRVGLSLID